VNRSNIYQIAIEENGAGRVYGFLMKKAVIKKLICHDLFDFL
jgi:hypothetical protein